MMIIRFNYCPANPGPKKKTNCKWFTNVQDAINNYDGHSSIWIKCGNLKFRKIDYNTLITL